MHFYRFLATGASFRSLAFSFRLGVKTVQRIVTKACKVLWTTLQPFEMPVPDKHLWEQIADGFSKKWNFPNCLGALDGKHLEMRAPNNSGSLYWNFKGYSSIVFMALVDAHNRFVVIDVGAYGSSSDGGIFKQTALSKHMSEGTLGIPNDSKIEGTNTVVPFVFVADEAFPLETHLMRPFPRRDLTDEKKIFNYRLSRARRQVECAFGVSSSVWRILLKPIETQPESACNIAKAVCVLHNFLINNNRQTGISQDDQEHDFSNTTGCPLRSSNSRPTGGAMAIRETFMNYFVSPAGAVPWQNDACLL